MRLFHWYRKIICRKGEARLGEKYVVKQLIGSLLLITSGNALLAAPFAYIPQPQNDQVAVFDLSTNAERSPTARKDNEPVKITILPVQHNPVAAAPNLAGTFVYVVNRDSNSITVIDSAKNTVVQNFVVGNKPIAAVVSRNDSKLYIAHEGDNTLQIIDTSKNTLLKTIVLDQKPSQLLLTAGGRLYVLSKEGKTVQAFDTQNDQSIFTLNTDAPDSGAGAPVAMTNLAEQTLFVGAADGDIYVWNVADPKNIAAQPKIELKKSAGKIKREIRALDSFYQTIYAALNDGDVLVIGSSTPNADYQYTVSTNTTPTGINISNNFQSVAVTNSKNNSVALIATADSKITYIDIGAPSAANGKFISAPSFQFVVASHSQEEDSNTYAWNTAKVQIKRVGNIAGIAKVHYQTESGTAFTKWDFLETKGDMEFQDGEDTKEVSVQILGDTTVEDDEYFTVKVTNPADGYNIGPQGSTEVILVNDDKLPTGAGCALGRNDQIDPLLPLLAGTAFLYLGARRKKKNRS